MVTSMYGHIHVWSHRYQDIKRLYPEEHELAQLTIIEAKEILSSFDTKLRAYTERLIKKRRSMKIVKASVTGWQQRE